MSFDVDPRDNRQEYPCECGGDISLVDGYWQCNNCDYIQKDKKND